MKGGLRNVQAQVSAESNNVFRTLLSRENVAAFKIQCFWRSYRINALYSRHRKGKAPPKIVIYGSSLGTNPVQNRNFSACKSMLDICRFSYETRDLVGNKSHQQEI